MPENTLTTPSLSLESLTNRGWRWEPTCGEETLRLLDNIPATREDEDTRERVLREARDILARCPSPKGSVMSSETGLAIGYVQSGKTMSFTTVAALARDNGYRVVIIVTGTSTSLTTQSRNRLVKDLQLATRLDRPWLHLFEEKPGPWARRTAQVKSTLEAWRDANGLPQDRRTVLITVMKHHRHLAAVTAMLRGVGSDVLGEAPTLIIDDEADQAGLNTLVQRNDQSTTYSCLLALKSQLPIHSYVQYTATPQAPLLINLIDILSPRFAALLTPGAAYVGGNSFFRENPRLHRNIPAAEIPQRNQPLQEAPESLLQALRVFLLGVAAGDVVDGSKGNRSMLVHPTHLRDGHTLYARWIREVARQWGAVLALPSEDPDRKELLKEFEAAYSDLQRTVGPTLPEFSTLCRRLLAAIRHTDIQVVNASTGSTPKIDWSSSYSFILVGGQAMDRGFTVEGLTVTYMPRGIGEGNADTVQQRARFFGYKRPYRGYCRVYLDPQTREAFEEYVTHEEDLRAQLREHALQGKTLHDWRREFLLTPLLRPTRKDVLGVPYVQEVVDGDVWIWMRRPHHDRNAMIMNRKIVEDFLTANRAVFSEFPGSALRTSPQRPRVSAGLDLNNVFRDLLTPLQFSFLEDSQRFTATLLVVEWYLRQRERCPTPCVVFEMGGDPVRRTRQRGLDDDGSIKNLFQGAAPVEPRSQRGSVYPGDIEIHDPNNVSIQIHRLELTSNNPLEVNGSVYTVAIRVPRHVSEGVIIQPQGGSR